jgi:hypothetical protein
VEDFAVFHTDLIPVHDFLQVKIKVKPSSVTSDRSAKALSYHDLFEKHVELSFQNAMTPISLDAARRGVLKDIHLHFTESLHNLKDHQELSQVSASEHWKYINAFLIDTFNEYFQLDDAEKKQYCNKGIKKIFKEQTLRPPVIHVQQGCTQPSMKDPEADFYLSLSRRFQAIADRVKIIGRNWGQEAAEELLVRNQNTATHILRDLQASNYSFPFKDEAIAQITRFLIEGTTPGNTHRFIFGFQNRSKALYRLYHEYNLNYIKHKAERKKAFIRQSSKNYFRSIKEPMTAPLSYILRKGNRFPEHLQNTYATSKHEIDEIIIAAWDHIHQGNSEDHESLVRDFFNKYNKDIFHRSQEYEIGDISAEELMHECLTAAHTSGSLDNWVSAELSILPLEVFQMLADFLNRVEKEGEWPDVLAHAKAAFLYKNNPCDAGPLDLRVLLITPVIYRRWASCRLQALRPWISEWATEDIFSGVPGQSSQDASYSTAILLEYLRCKGDHFSGGAGDIYKAFDQIVRLLVERLLVAAGMPQRILKTYISCLSKLVIHNVFSGHIGKGHKHHCGIPQGCSFSIFGFEPRPEAMDHKGPGRRRGSSHISR